jgi:hypothetical protein
LNYSNKFIVYYQNEEKEMNWGMRAALRGDLPNGVEDGEES